VVGGSTPELRPATELRQAWLTAGGGQLSDAHLTTEVRRLGGEPDVTDDGQLVFRFADLARESKALTTQRRSASPTERSPGEVIFSSLPDDEP
jgi:hypothetical protein